MEFASSHVYRYDCSDEECVSEEEYDQGMQLSDDEDLGPSVNLEEGMGGMSDDVPAEPCRYTDSPSVAAAPRAAPRSSGAVFFEKITSRFSSSVSKKPTARIRTTEVKGKKKKVGHWRAAKSNVADMFPTDAPPPGGKKWRRADTNVISVMFNKLTEPGNMHTGDPVFCSQCQAVLSHISKMTQEEPGQVWKCEFCGTINEVDLSEEETPKKDDITFMLEPALSTTTSGQSGIDKSLVIFCVDTSGSMCVTTEVPGRIQLRGSHLERLQGLNDTDEDQFLPRQSRNVTYISRLQGMQAAVDHQLAEMQKNNPERCVALVTFNSEVTVVGDGFGLPVHISGDKLKDKDEMINMGKEMALPKPIKDSRLKLGEKVFDLEEGGATALGPALLLSISMASQVAGSKVIICTDGMANVGLGSMEKSSASQDEDEHQKLVTDYYSEISTLAVDNGVCVSVTSIKGTDCKMVELGHVADATGGQVNIVDPLKLTQEFGTILADPVIATKVTATMLLHKQLYFRHEESVAGNRVVRYVGNVTKDTEITFEYGVKNFAKKKKAHPTVPEEAEEGEAGCSGEAASGSASTAAASCTDDMENLTQLPFQLQIVYTDINGAKAMRLLTQCKPVTDERSVAEQNINVAVLGSHTAQLSAKLAKKGEYTKARLNSMVNQRLVARNTWERPDMRGEYQAFYDNIMPVERHMNVMQKKERFEYGHSHSDEEDEDEESSARIPKIRIKKKAKAMSRRAECSDEMAAAIYSNANISSKAFAKK